LRGRPWTFGERLRRSEKLAELWLKNRLGVLFGPVNHPSSDDGRYGPADESAPVEGAVAGFRLRIRILVGPGPLGVEDGDIGDGARLERPPALEPEDLRRIGRAKFDQPFEPDHALVDQLCERKAHA